MGCPKKFSVSGGMGSALLTDLPRACDIVKTLRRNISLPVSAKVRLLKDTASTLDFLRGLIQAGANALTIHAREVGDPSTDPAKWDRLMEVIPLLKGTAEGSSVPVVINGDFFTRNQMVNMKRKCLSDGVMLARPALFNTSIFRKPEVQLSTHCDTEAVEETRYSFDSNLLLPKTQVVQNYLSFCVRYQANPVNAKYVICEFMSNRRMAPRLIPYMPQLYPGGQTIDKVCKCHTLEELCSLWDINSSGQQAHTLGIKQTTDDHKYDDRYFLDHETFTREHSKNVELETLSTKSPNKRQKL
jgi:tRNA-dihydrouridine synthase